jgi:cation/acetate symporter
MPTAHSKRRINPRLGTYFGIFVSAFLSLVLLALIAEQLGASDSTLRWTVFIGPLVLYVAIGSATLTREPADYFVAGRRVPAFFTGLGLATSALGGVGVVSVTGLLMMNGIDAWSVVNGVVAGMVVCAILVAPYMRKFGSYTLPSYLGRRFDSRMLRLVAAATLSVPLLLIIVAELKIGLIAATLLTGAASELMAAALAVAILAMIGLGGMRSLSWAGTAAALAVLIAMVVPAAIVATEVTNFPLAQLSHGPILRAVGRLEDVRGIAMPVLSPLAFDLAGGGLEPLTRRMAHPFGSIGPGSYILVSFALMMGIAVAPWLFPRIGATPGVYEARKSLGWAVFVFGALMLTASAVAVFQREVVMTQLVGQSQEQLPEWFNALAEAGHAAVDGRQPQLPMSSFLFKRDTVLFWLPIANHFPAVLAYLALAGGLAAALCGASSAIFAMGSILAEDVINGSQWEAPAAGPRLLVARAATAATAVTGALLALKLPADPLQLALWALGICGATAFPVVVLSIWWKRLTTTGALFGVATGFATAVLAIIAGESSWFGVPSGLVSVFTVPVGLMASFVGTRMTTAPERHVLELVRDVRMPGGEAVYDREQRLMRLKRRQRPA